MFFFPEKWFHAWFAQLRAFGADPKTGEEPFALSSPLEMEQGGAKDACTTVAFVKIGQFWTNLKSLQIQQALAQAGGPHERSRGVGGI